jgi:hypothetical protein
VAVVVGPSRAKVASMPVEGGAMQAQGVMVLLDLLQLDMAAPVVEEITAVMEAMASAVL